MPRLTNLAAIAGIFFAASTLGRKSVTAFGTIVAGAALSAARFHADDAASARRLAGLYVPIVMTANLLGVALFLHCS